MHQIRFRLGLRPRPRWGAYSAHPDPLLEFRGPTSKGRGGKGRTKERSGMVGGEEGKGKERGGRETGGCAPQTKILPTPLGGDSG